MHLQKPSNTRGTPTCRLGILAGTLCLSAIACALPEADPASPFERRFLGEFVARADLEEGTLVFEWAAEADGSETSARGLVGEIPVEQDGVPCTSPPSGPGCGSEGIELVTLETGDNTDALCGRQASFCGRVLMRSFYPGSEIRGAFIELTSIVPAPGHTAFGDHPPDPGHSDTYGLWRYGNIAPNGEARRVWKFDRLDEVSWTLRGLAYGDVQPVGAPHEDCTALGDEDGDGEENCDDLECNTHAACTNPGGAPRENACGNGFDDDGDSLIDCDDHADCDAAPACATGCVGGAPDGDATDWEECDDGNALGGDGCENDCTVSERGVAVGSVPNIYAERAAFDLTHTQERHNINHQAYNSTSSRAAQLLDILKPDVVTPRNLRITTPRTRVPWSSFEGRAASALFVLTGFDPSTSNWPMPDHALCIQPVERADCCNYWLTEGVEGSGVSTEYLSPRDLYADDASAANALSQIYATRPIFLPYTDSRVYLANGWIYDEPRSPHGSADYQTSTQANVDSSFEVKSVAAGTVISKFWEPWHGNVVIIEHPGVNGFTYRSHYFHLRDGKTHDINKAQTETAPGDGAPQRYLNFANLSTHNDLHWGTDAHAIRVDVGDSVGDHTQIGWSGNTGPGGAAAGLEDDGTPTNATSANNHLHFMLSVRHATWTGGEWLYIDPYGVYEQRSSGCYDLLDNTQYDRLFAPFYPYFHGVDLAVFNAYLYYYGQMGRSPAAFTVQRGSGGVHAAGAFKTGLSSSWLVYDYMTPAAFQVQFDAVTANPPNFSPVDRSVSLDNVGQPRHNGIFRPDLTNDWLSFGDQTFLTYQTKFNDLTDPGSGYDLTDFFAYRYGLSNRVASIYEKVPGGFIHEAHLSSNTLKNNANNYATSGWLPVDMNVEELWSGTKYSALYRQTGDMRMMHWGMTPSEYQQWMSYYLSNGWDLHMVQNYGNGSRYAAIWKK